ncbi:30S ribosomal protein S4 [Patescibacteria group bacterium]|nr:30S ribosomal protein S4 [Patescibacteria group bacterium]
MARNLDPKCKQCRREGTKLFLKGERCNTSKCALTRRNYIPGMHGVKLGKGGRLTGYGIQLREKQKAKRTYRLLEKQFRSYFDKAISEVGDTGENIYKLLEMRMDNVIYRAGFCNSRDFARQMVNHGHFLLNGRRASIPSINVKVKDKITFRPKSLEIEEIKNLPEKLKNKEMTDWLVVEPESLTITVLDVPSSEKSKPNFDLRAINEYYSR